MGTAKDVVSAGVARDEVVRALGSSHVAVKGNKFGEKNNSGDSASVKSSKCSICGRFFLDCIIAGAECEATQRRAGETGSKCRHCFLEMGHVQKNRSVAFLDEVVDGKRKRDLVLEGSEKRRLKWQRQGRPAI